MNANNKVVCHLCQEGSPFYRLNCVCISTPENRYCQSCILKICTRRAAHPGFEFLPHVLENNVEGVKCSFCSEMATLYRAPEESGSKWIPLPVPFGWIYQRPMFIQQTFLTYAEHFRKEEEKKFEDVEKARDKSIYYLSKLEDIRDKISEEEKSLKLEKAPPFFSDRKNILLCWMTIWQLTKEIKRILRDLQTREAIMDSEEAEHLFTVIRQKKSKRGIFKAIKRREEPILFGRILDEHVYLSKLCFLYQRERKLDNFLKKAESQEQLYEQKLPSWVMDISGTEVDLPHLPPNIIDLTKTTVIDLTEETVIDLTGETVIDLTGDAGGNS